MKGGGIKSAKWYYCGPASLAWALARLGIKRSQQTLAKHCRTTQKRGTSNSMLVAVAKQYGLSVQTHEQVSWYELKQLASSQAAVIVGWYSDFNQPYSSHFSGVLGVTPWSITLMDPELGDARIMTRKEFLKRWHDYDSAKRRPLKRWLVAIGL